MSTDRELLELAAQSFVDCWDSGHFFTDRHAERIRALRAALAEPEHDLVCVCGAVWEGETMVHPPRKREWVGLTHPQIHELDWPDGVSFEDILLFVRAIEQALKEKNHG